MTDSQPDVIASPVDAPVASPPRAARWAAWLAWLALTVFWWSRWPSFPIGSDPSYHLFIAQEMQAAHGVIAVESLQYAPVGRAHVYPPALHLVLSALLALGLAPIFALRLLSFLVIPLLLGSVYLAMERVIDQPTALACLLLGLLPFSWMLHIGGTMASGLALIELLWLLVAVREERTLASTLLLALLYYTHLGLAWIALASLIGGCRLGGARWRLVLTTTLVSLLLAAPWLWHLAVHAHVFQVVPRYEDRIIDLVPLIELLAIVGAWYAWKRRGPGRLLLSLWLAFCLMACSFRFRWLSGEGVLPVVMLAGYGLAAALEARVGAAHRRRRLPLGIAAGALVVCLSPTLTMEQRSVRVRWPDTAPFHLAHYPSVAPKAADIQLYSQHIDRLVGEVESLSRPGEIIWSNAAYTAGLIAALAHRALSSAMFFEIPPADLTYDPLAAAHLVLWFKLSDMPGMPALEELVQRYQLRMVANDELALILRHDGARALAHSPHAVVPLWLAVVLLCGASGLAAWDLQPRS